MTPSQDEEHAKVLGEVPAEQLPLLMDIHGLLQAAGELAFAKHGLSGGPEGQSVQLCPCIYWPGGRRLARQSLSGDYGGNVARAVDVHNLDYHATELLYAGRETSTMLWDVMRSIILFCPSTALLALTRERLKFLVLNLRGDISEHYSVSIARAEVTLSRHYKSELALEALDPDRPRLRPQREETQP